MTLQEAIVARHSVRQYIEKPIEAEKIEEQKAIIDYAKLDLGIAKYHFEVGAGRENFEWA